MSIIAKKINDISYNNISAIFSISFEIFLQHYTVIFIESREFRCCMNVLFHSACRDSLLQIKTEKKRTGEKKEPQLKLLMFT